MNTEFKHRSAIGVWINDIRDEAFSTGLWPPMKIDGNTQDSLRRCIDTLSQWGYNELCLWGLLNSYSWSLDFSRELRDVERLAKVSSLIDYAHQAGLKVIYGLGVYSWGYDNVIKSDSLVRGTSEHAMCGSAKEAFNWVAKAIDFIFNTLSVDGLHFESADQGRCRCNSCSKLSDFEYHCTLNAKMAVYVKQRWPEKIVMSNLVSWQSWDRKISNVNAPEIEMIRSLGRYTDYIIDPGHLGYYFEEKVLPVLTSSLSCAFGNAGGFWTYYWPAWDRLRAFLPYTRTAYDSIQRLYAAGGRALEYYTGPMLNPGAEINTAFAGCIMNDISIDYRDALEQVINKLYRPLTSDALKKLVEIVEYAETSWFIHWTARLPESWKPNDADLSVTFDDFDSYSKSEASRPCQIFFDGVKHLTEYIKPNKWPLYRDDLIALKENTKLLLDSVYEKEKLSRMITCFDRTIEDLDELIEFEYWK